VSRPTFELNVARSVWLTTVVVPTKIHFKINAIADILNPTGLFFWDTVETFQLHLLSLLFALRSRNSRGRGSPCAPPPETPLCASAHLR